MNRLIQASFSRSRTVLLALALVLPACGESTAQEGAPTDGKPRAVIAHTIKGKGVSFMEATHAWHGKAPNDEELDLALNELGATEAQRG